MRRQVIHFLLPLVFCTVPLLAAALVAVSLPPLAREFYLKNISGIDHLILVLGTCLFTVQILFTWQALRWRDTNFDERPDPWLTNLAQAAEWFPLLGLLGTVAGIMQTFSSVKEKMEAAQIIGLYAPAITATGSGLLMALANILPTWIVMVGRDLIRALAGDPPAPPAVPPTAATAPAATVARR